MGTEQTKRHSEQVTGVSNVAYDLMSVLQNTLEGIAALEVYKEDARNAGDQEAQNLFEQLEQRLTGDVERLRGLLVQRLQ